MEIWREYYSEFAKRIDRIPSGAFDRKALLSEAAHDAYQATTNRLTAHGWEGEAALMAGRLFSAVTKEWLDRGGDDFARLQQTLESRFNDWNAKKVV